MSLQGQSLAHGTSTVMLPVMLGALAAMMDIVFRSKDPGTGVGPSGMGANPEEEEEVWHDRPELGGASVHWRRTEQGPGVLQ